MHFYHINSLSSFKLTVKAKSSTDTKLVDALISTINRTALVERCVLPLNATLTPAQHDALDNINGLHNAVAGARRTGRTTILVGRLLVDAVLETGNFMYVTANQARLIAVHTFVLITLARIGVKPLLITPTMITLSGGSTLYLVTATMPNVLRGIRLRGVALDDLTSYQPNVITNLQPALHTITSTSGYVLSTW